MSVKGLYFCRGGSLELDKSIITYRTDIGKKTRIHVVISLVETTDGFVLFDTGLNPRGLDNPDGTWGAMAPLIKEFREENDVRNRLREMGLKSEDIAYVVNSHLHYDHTGGNQFFPKAKFIVQKAEYRFALFPDSFAASAYRRDHFDLPYDYRLIEGDCEVIPGVFLMLLPGHTPGSQAMAMRLPETGTVVLTGDVFYSRENVEKNIPAGNSWSMGEAVRSMNRLSEFRKREDGRLFVTHDPDFWGMAEPFPYCYR